ncbi:hypothetical protein [Plantactinospora sp. GCM10030261]|uniref:hypothetical protein n=1 Tax=Plantactinospora sp. GCM10030261 TaxID=3273420 RepID=UPI00361B8EA5
MRRRPRRWVAAVLVGALVTTGCQVRSVVHDGPVRLAWRPAALPIPAGASRAVLRDLVSCAGRWFLVGGLVDAAGGTSPAAWDSPDGRSWHPVPIDVVSFYGRQSVLYAVGCRAGRPAAVAAKTGGSHGNPRIVGFRPVGGDPAGGPAGGATAGDRLVEVTTPVRGGDAPGEADLTRIAGGPGGWVIAGSRTAGATTWWSADATAFDGAVLPEKVLPPDGAEVSGGATVSGGADAPVGGRSRAFDVVATAAGWLAVGVGHRRGDIDPVPAAWTSVDGRGWRPAPVPVGGDSGQLERVALVRGRPVAVGPRDDGFGVWRGGPPGADWVPSAGFPVTAGGGVPTVRGLAVVAGRLVAATSDGGGHALWISDGDGANWRPVAGPAGPLPAGGGDRRVVLAGAGDALVAAIDDGARADLWWSPVPDHDP